MIPKIVGEGGTGYQSVIFPKTEKSATAKLPPCTRRFLARPLAEASRNGTAPVPTAARFALETSVAKPARKRNSRSVPTPSTGFSSVLLPTCAHKSKLHPNFIRELTVTQLVTRRSREPFFLTP